FVLALWSASAGNGNAVGHSSLVGVALAGSLGLGAMLQSIQKSPPRNLASILTGSVVSVDQDDLVLTVIVAAAVLAVLAAMHKELVYSAFDATGARSAGFGRWLDLVVHLCVAVAVVSTVPALGTVLAPSLLIVPAMAARLWTERVGAMMAIATAIALVAALSGLLWSTEQRIAAGPAITLVATGLFALSALMAPHGLVRHATT
ncbi:MAG: metal ABC transporter permease, partial [Acidimicrobiia bacterium]